MDSVLKCYIVLNSNYKCLEIWRPTQDNVDNVAQKTSDGWQDQGDFPAKEVTPRSEIAIHDNGRQHHAQSGGLDPKRALGLDKVQLVLMLFQVKVVANTDIEALKAYSFVE